MNADHDAGYKLLFAHPEMVRDLLTGYVQGEWIEEAESVRTAVDALFRLEHGRSPEDLRQMIRALGEMLQDPTLTTLRRSFTIWIKSLLRRKIPVAQEAEINKITDLMEADTMLAERIEGWFEDKWQQGMQQGMQRGMQQGMQQGMQRGMLQGEGILLRRLLTRRFDPLSDAIEARLANANTDQLEIWGDRILDAKSLDDVFREH